MKFLWLSIVFLISTPTIAKTFGPYPAEVLKVIDGDTVKVRAEIWPGLFKVINVGLGGINTPESRNGKINGEKIPVCEIALGKKAKEFTTLYLKGPITLFDVSLGKYAGRVLGRLRTNEGTLSSALLKNGLAIPYSGGKRSIWDCR